MLFFWSIFIPAVLVIAVMLGRISLLQAGLFLVRSVLKFFIKGMTSTAESIRTKIDEINSQQVVFFTRGDNLANLNNAMLYVKQNEHTNRIKVVTVVQNKDEVPKKLEKDLKFLNEALSRNRDRIRGYNRNIWSRPYPGIVGKVEYSCQPDVYRFPQSAFYIWLGAVGRCAAELFMPIHKSAKISLGT